jgi:flagellar FliJ protein
MKRFRFSLRSVAVLRAHRETRAREQFAASVHAYVRAEEELAMVRRRIKDFGDAIFASRRELFDASEHALCLAGYRRECASEIPAERAVIDAKDAMAKRRADYLEAHRELEAVRKLEEKNLLAYRAACNREEQVEFDEMAGHRAGRKAAFGT